MGDGHGSSASAVVERGPVLTGESGTRFYWLSQECPQWVPWLSECGYGSASRLVFGGQGRYALGNHEARNPDFSTDHPAG